MKTKAPETVPVDTDILMRVNVYLHDMATICKIDIEHNEEMILNFCDTPENIAFVAAVESYKSNKKHLDRILALITQIEGTGFKNI